MAPARVMRATQHNVRAVGWELCCKLGCGGEAGGDKFGGDSIEIRVMDTTRGSS